MIKVGIVGYGTIGRRVADAIDQQNDMKLVGVTKNSPDYGVFIAHNKGHRLHGMDTEAFRGVNIAGGIENLIEEVDIIVDCAPKGKGKENIDKYYKPAGIPAIFQGAEKADVGVSFNANSNFDQAKNVDYVRVVSCNTTGLARLLHLVNREFGIMSSKIALIRRAADPKEYKKGPIDAIVPDPVGLSHHAPDLRTVLAVPINTTAYKVPTTLMHAHDVFITTKEPVDEALLLEKMDEEPRILLADPKHGFSSTAQVMDYARDLRLRGDIFENVVFKGFTVTENEIYLTQAIHQEAIVIPDNIDAIRAMFGGEKEKSMAETNKTLRIGQMKMS